MNKRDLKRLKLDDSYVIDPVKFLISFGVEYSGMVEKITIHDLHYILHNRLHHVGIKNVSADKIYRGEIILVGTPNKFYPYYNPVRSKIKPLAVTDERVETKMVVINLKIYNMTELYSLHRETLEQKYLNEIYDRAYTSLHEEQAPSKQKIYHRPKKMRKH